MTMWEAKTKVALQGKFRCALKIERYESENKGERVRFFRTIRLFLQ